MVVMAIHSFLSLSWDEWGSIFVIAGGILGALICIIKWGIARINNEVFKPIYTQMKSFNTAIKEMNANHRKMRDELQRGDEKFMLHDEKLNRHEDQLEDHEKRIRRLEHDKNGKD